MDAKEAKIVNAKKRWDDFPDKEIATGFETGLWLVDESVCVAGNYSEGVFT